MKYAGGLLHSDSLELSQIQRGGFGPAIGLKSFNRFSGSLANLGSMVSHSIFSFLGDVNPPITRIALTHPSFTCSSRNNPVDPPPDRPGRQSGVAVEKLFFAKFAKMKFREDAL